MTMAALMRQKKFLESLDLTPEVLAVADGSRILGGVHSGSIDVSVMSGFGQVFPAIERGADLKIIIGAALLPLLALHTAKGSVRRLKDLEGKKVGVGSIGALVHQLTVTLLRKFSVNISRLRFVNIGSSADIFRAVTARTADGGAGPASLVDDAESYKVSAIPKGNMTAELKEFTYQAGWTSSRTIAANAISW
ncbi:MAG: ABC transporter substrate-binding protein [Terriglobia bacterium]